MGVLDGWRHCPRCASPLEHADGKVACPACGFEHWAHSSPAVSAFVVGERGSVLLGRRAVEPDAGLWDSLGGFLDEGEDPLAGLRRELREETGLEADPGTFVGAFIDTYGHDDDAPPILNLVWEATFGSGEPAPADDVTELRWFARADLPADDEIAFRWLAPALRDWFARA